MAEDPDLARKFAKLSELARTSSQEQVAAADNILRDSVMTAAVEVVELLKSDRDNIRLTAARYILDRYLPAPEKAPADDPLANFIEAVSMRSTSN